MTDANLRARVSALELMFSKTTLTGMCTSIDKKFQAMINQRLIDLEKRTMIVADSKVDSADYYLKLKSKLDKIEFEKVLAELVQVRKNLDEVTKTNIEIREQFNRSEERHSNELNKTQSQLKQLRADFQDYCNEQNNMEDIEDSIPAANISGKFTTSIESISKLINNTENHVDEKEQEVPISRANLNKPSEDSFNSLGKKAIVTEIKGLVNNLKRGSPRNTAELKNLIESVRNLQVQIENLEMNYKELHKRQNDLVISLGEINNKTNKLKETCDVIGANRNEDMGRFMQLKSQVESLYMAVEDHKEKLVKGKQTDDKLIKDQGVLEEGLNKVKAKCSLVEYKQIALTEKFNFQISDENKLTKVDLKEIFELSEVIKETSKIILKENEVVKKDFNTIKNILNIELQRLKTENELLLRENKRIYERTRNIESLFNKMNEEYKGVAKNQRGIESVPRMIINKTRLDKPTSKDALLVYPNQTLYTRMTNNIRNIQIRKLKNAHRLSSMSEVMNNTRTERFDSQEEIEYGGDKVKNERIALNNLKVAYK